MDSFDFDTWANLAKNDPERFEQERQTLLEGLLAQAPLDLTAKNQLRAVLFNPERANQDPQAAMVQAQQSMWVAFGQLRSEFARLESAVAPLAPEHSDAIALLTKVV